MSKKKQQGGPEPPAVDDGFSFELSQQSKTVTIKDEEGVTRSYILKEAMGDQAAQWRNWMLSKAQLDPKTGKPKSFGQIAESEPYLVSLCLFKAEGKKDNVSFGEVKNWPNRVIRKMFTWIKDVSDLEEDEEDLDAAKNEQDGTPDGS